MQEGYCVSASKKGGDVKKMEEKGKGKKEESGYEETGTGERKVYKCHYCGARFSKLWQVKKHIKTAHPDL